MSKPIFKEATGVTVISARTGKTVLWLDMMNLTIDEARAVMDAILPALEAAFAKPKEQA